MTQFLNHSNRIITFWNLIYSEPTSPSASTMDALSLESEPNVASPLDARRESSIQYRPKLRCVPYQNKADVSYANPALLQSRHGDAVRKLGKDSLEKKHPDLGQMFYQILNDEMFPPELKNLLWKSSVPKSTLDSYQMLGNWSGLTPHLQLHLPLVPQLCQPNR